MEKNTVSHKLFSKADSRHIFDEATLARFREIRARYPQDSPKSALIPVMHLAQESNGGYLSVAVMDAIAAVLDLQPVEVYEVATFYTQFNLEKRGKYLIEVCRTGPCAICGAEDLQGKIEKLLQIREGETTGDGLFTLKTVECIGACGYAPAILINNEFYEKLDEAKIAAVLENLRKDSLNSKA